VIRDFMVVAFVRCQRLPNDRIESIENGNKRTVIVKSMDRLPWSSSACTLGFESFTGLHESIE
jgi:hypothetical protein